MKLTPEEINRYKKNFNNPHARALKVGQHTFSSKQKSKSKLKPLIIGVTAVLLVVGSINALGLLSTPDTPIKVKYVRAFNIKVPEGVIPQVITVEEEVKKNEKNEKNLTLFKQLKRVSTIESIKYVLRDGLLKELAPTIVSEGEINRVNPMLMCAIIQFESRTWSKKHNRWVAGTNLGTKNLNNFCGMNARKGFPTGGRNNRYAKYPSLESATKDLAFWLRYHYLEGRNSLNLHCKDIYDIASIYCPPEGDKWDGKWGMNNSLWPKAVTKMYHDIFNMREKILDEKLKKAGIKR